MKQNVTYKVINLILIVVVFFSLKHTAFGQLSSERKAYATCNEFIKKSVQSKSYKIKNLNRLILNDTSQVFVLSLNPIGFVIISKSSIDNPILGFSFENDFSFNEDQLQIVSSILENTIQSKQKISPRNITSDKVDPLIKSLFGQVNCYDNDDNLINVSNLYTPNNYAPGCVAISLSTLLHYYQWPLVGMGNHTYNDNKGASTGVYTADFSLTEYNWDDILNRYRYKNSTIAQRQALGELVYQTAVALDMNFEYNGATSNISKIPNTGKKYFRFIAKRVPATSLLFWKAVDSNLVHKMPVIFSISASNGAGHSIVCDGFKFDNGTEYHHVNMGWWGTSNGWYSIKNGFNVGGYNKIEHGLINFIPVPMILEPQVSVDSQDLEIHWVVSNTITPNAFELQFKTDTSNWVKISDTLTSSSFKIEIDDAVKEYSFRVRAKIEGKWYSDSWSNISVYKKNTTAVLSDDLDAINIYPNPCNDIVNINLEHKYQVSLFSMDGNRLYDKNLSGNSIISMKEYDNGIYILKIQKGSKIIIKKLVKMN